MQIVRKVGRLESFIVRSRYDHVEHFEIERLTVQLIFAILKRERFPIFDPKRFLGTGSNILGASNVLDCF